MIIRNNIIINKFLNVYKRIMGNPDEHHGLRYLGYCDLLDQEANDYIYELLSPIIYFNALILILSVYILFQ